MYKIIYNDKLSSEDMVDNIDSVIIDVRDIDNMKYVDIIYKGDINLLILYVRCLKYYHSKLRLNDRFVINNKYKDNKKITRAILDCKWLINEDDVVYNLDILEDQAKSFIDEVEFLSKSDALKDIHKKYLMNYYLTTLKNAKKRIGLNDEKKLNYVKK